MGTGRPLENVFETRNTSIPFIDISYEMTRVSCRGIYGRWNCLTDLRLTSWYVHAPALQGKNIQNMHTAGQILGVVPIRDQEGCGLQS